jgi:hypothetical protein
MHHMVMSGFMGVHEDSTFRIKVTFTFKIEAACSTSPKTTWCNNNPRTKLTSRTVWFVTNETHFQWYTQIGKRTD